MPTARLSTPVRWPGGWCTWVSATAACLEALGLAWDRPDVAGTTGFPFALAVREGLDASGPLAFDWRLLDAGLPWLGRSSLCFSCGQSHTPGTANEATRAHCRAAFTVAEQEVLADRPCVLWGAYLPTFAVVTGVTPDHYHVASYRQATGEAEPPIRFDDVNAPDGPYLLAFPTAASVAGGPGAGDRWALARGAALLRSSAPEPDVARGLAAYALWAEALRAGRAEPWGAALTAQMWAESRALLRTWLERVVARQPRVARTVARAADGYAEAATALKRVATLFPYPPRRELEEPARRTAGAALLEQARAAEARALEAFDAALAAPW